MAGNGEKVVVAMSGGVDSSVAACLLAEAGYDVVGLFMRTGVSHPEPQASACANSAPTNPQPSVDACASSPDATTGRGQENTLGTEPRNQSRDREGAAERSANDPSPDPMPTTTDDRCAGSKGHNAATTDDRHRGCCSASDAADARYVAGMLGVPFYALNFETEFDELIDYFADEYVAGRTPNPCVVCNDRLKFGRLIEYADAVGARYIATGHYARLQRRGTGNALLRAVDRKKDQSYVLFGLRREVLDRLIFPVGDLQKDEVRRIATRYNLPNRDKPDSVEICFVPDRDYARVVRERRPEAFREGNVIGPDGSVLGRHRGIGHYTIGQRRGLGIAAGRPVYVTELNVAANTVRLGDGHELLAPGLIAGRANYLVDVPAGPFRADVKIRYLHRPAPATVEVVEPADRGSRADASPDHDGHPQVRVTFDEPQRAVTPGQAVVFYDGDVVLGGAWIVQSAH